MSVEHNLSSAIQYNLGSIAYWYMWGWIVRYRQKYTELGALGYGLSTYNMMMANNVLGSWENFRHASRRQRSHLCLSKHLSVIASFVDPTRDVT